MLSPCAHDHATLHVKPTPQSIGRALYNAKMRCVWLHLSAANDIFLQWARHLGDDEWFTDVKVHLGHFELATVAWEEKLSFLATEQHRASMKLLLCANKHHRIFGMIPKDILVSQIFTKLRVTHMVYTPHVSVMTGPIQDDDTHEEDRAEWMDTFFQYWQEQQDSHGWGPGSDEWREMGVAVCGRPTDDSITCGHTSCVACADFIVEASEYSIYDI